MDNDDMELFDDDYKKCQRDEFYIKVEKSRFPADDRRGEIVSIFKRGWFFPKRIKSVIVTQGDGGEGLSSTIASMNDEVDKYIKYSK